MSNGTAGHGRTASVTLIATSDIHGAFFPNPGNDATANGSSLANVCAYVRQQRTIGGKSVVLLDNGDVLQGQPICHYLNYVKANGTALAAQIMDFMGYDACTLGNHDIATGHATCSKWIRHLHCPTLTSNIFKAKCGMPYARPFAIIERNGLRIAVIGLLSAAAFDSIDSVATAGMSIDDPAGAAKRWIDIIREEENPDVVVGLLHCGWEANDDGIHSRTDPAEYIANNVPGLDIIVFGHDHKRHEATIVGKDGHKVLCLNPACGASAVAEATITYERKGNKAANVSIEGSVVDVSQVVADAEFCRHFAKEAGEAAQYLKRQIGFSAVSIGAKECLFGCAPLSGLFHSFMLAATNADVSFFAPLSIETELKEGNFTNEDLIRLYPYDDRLCTLRMSGREIRRYLEMTYQLWTQHPGKHDGHALRLKRDATGKGLKYTTAEPIFNLDSAAGIIYDVDITKPDGHKVTIKTMQDGTPFCDDRIYKVAMSSFRLCGGGGLLRFGAGIGETETAKRILSQSKECLRSLFMDEIGKSGKINPAQNRNWSFTPQEEAETALKNDKVLL